MRVEFETDARSHAPPADVSVTAVTSEAPAPPPSAYADVDAATSQLPREHSEWCQPPWYALDSQICYWLPETAPRALLIYLSGIVPPGRPGALQLNMQRVVVAAARRAGVAVLLPRGRQGLGPAATRSWWSWPTSRGDIDAHAPAMIEAWLAARSTLERALPVPFERSYLAGSSSGAYFLTSLAARGSLEVDGFAATSGGGASARALAAAARKVPFYVGYGSGDPARAQVRGLGRALAESGWPVRVAEHPGGHGAREIYLDEAFAFFAEHQSAP